MVIALGITMTGEKVGFVETEREMQQGLVILDGGKFRLSVAAPW